MAFCLMTGEIIVPPSANSLTVPSVIAQAGGVIQTDDCRKSYEELKARGVEFLQEPAERPYGIEALLRDDSGNWFSLTQPKWADAQAAAAREATDAPVNGPVA